MDPNTITAAAQSLGLALDIAKGIATIKDATKREAMQFELQRHILDAQRMTIEAQSQQLELISRVSAAEAEVARLKQWEAEAGAYKLEEIPVGAFVWVSQPTGDPADQEVWLCPKCFTNKQFGVLTSSQRKSDYTRADWSCTNCGRIIETETQMKPGHWRHRVEQLAVDREIRMRDEQKFLDALKAKRDSGT